MRISIVTPTYNSASTIIRCINSIIAQDYQSIEHIIIDGGSTDGTLEILNKMGVHYISEPDAGVYHAMNKGIRAASGEIIHILNSDDWYRDNNIISEMVNMMTSGNYDVCHALISVVNNEDKEIRCLGADVNKAQLLQKMLVAHPSVFVKSSVYQRFGDFSIGIKIAGDYDFMLRIWDKVNIGFYPKKIVNMQVGGISSQPLKACIDSLAVGLIHGKKISSALITFFFELTKSYLGIYARILGYKW